MEELVGKLREFGLNEYEAKAFVALATHSSCTASDISEYAKIPQSKVYEIVKSLEMKGLVETWKSKPQRYKAVEPSIALTRIIERRKEKLNSLKRKVRILSEKLVPAIPKDDRESEIWSFSGRREFLEKSSEMLNRSKKYAYGMTRNFSRTSMLEKAMEEALKRGVKIRLLGVEDIPDTTTLARAKWYIDNGTEVRIMKVGPHPRVCLIDGKEVCIRIDDPFKSEFIWSNNDALINLMKSHFDSLWRRAKEIDPKKFKEIGG